MTRAGVEVRDFNSYLTGDHEEVWRNRWNRTIPVEVKQVETTVLGKDTALVSGLGAEEARLSPLGLTRIFHEYEIFREDVPFKASPPSPYTVSVGKATRPPLFIISPALIRTVWSILSSSIFTIRVSIFYQCLRYFVCTEI